MNQIYNVGIYCRLSVDDANNSAKAKTYIPADESVSIENQRELLSKFVMLNGWVEVKTYVDDGYSGANFQRPGFQEMMEDARKGVINLILVKDLSRLGRDFVEVGRYTTEIFPALGVRFVSVLDCLDTDGDNTDMLHFRSLMNDYHLRDLSSKIKSVLHSKKASGQFVAAYAPYGYKKSDEDNHKLVIDEVSAAVVRRIFDMRKSGMSYGGITAVLNREHIDAPRFYCYQRTGRDTSKVTRLWADNTVKVILRNEVYLGNLRSNHTGTQSYKNHSKIQKPESDWICHVGAHEAIITAETWEAVQELNRTAKAKYRGTEQVPKLFSGKLVCADCKHTLYGAVETHRHKDGSEKKFVSYHCSLYRRSGRSVCSWHTIYEKTLVQIVLSEIRTQAKAVVFDEAAIVRKIMRDNAKGSEQMDMIRKEIAQLRHRIQELENLTAKLYEDKISGTVSADSFSVLMQRNETERQEKIARLEALLPEVNRVDKETADVQTWMAHIRKYLDLKELDRGIVEELIDHIEIGERTVIDGQRRQEIKVFYRFVGLVDNG